MPVARDRTVVVVLFLMALAARIVTVWHSPGGFTGDPGYDSGVYYAGADALVHGRLPYRDFVMLHPPGITLVTFPFAAIGTVIGDHRAFVLADLAFMAMGAANACLVYLIARAAQLRMSAAMAGALLYALWFSAVHADLSIRLEPVSTLAFLTGLLLLLRRDGRLCSALAGFAFGFAVFVKIWWVVPLLVMLVWLAASRADRARTGWVGAGAVLAGVAVGGPFFLDAPTRMWRMLVTDQVGRTRNDGLLTRLASLTSSPSAFPHDLAARHVAAAVVTVLLVAGVALGLTVPRLRVVGVVVLAQGIVLALAPSFFTQYAGYLTGTVSVAFAAGVSALPARVRRVRSGALLACAAVGVCVVLSVAAVAQDSPVISSRLSLARAEPTIRAAHCVSSDSPFALIKADVLSRDYSRGCADWVDVVGKVYDIDGRRGRHVPRMRDLQWQRALRRYFLRSEAVVLMRRSTGVSRPVVRAISGAGRVRLGHGAYLYVPRPVTRRDARQRSSAATPPGGLQSYGPAIVRRAPVAKAARITADAARS